MHKKEEVNNKPANTEKNCYGAIDGLKKVQLPFVRSSSSSVHSALVINEFAGTELTET
jgi:hypothetical protein